MRNFDFTSGTVTTTETTTTGTVTMQYVPVTPETDCVDRAVDPEWLKAQPWFVRLDEWHHAHVPHGWIFHVWFWLWRPICNFADRYHCRGIPDAPKWGK